MPTPLAWLHAFGVLAPTMHAHATQRQQWFLHHWVWDAWRRYFRYRGVVPAAPLTTDPDKHFIFVHVPHAVFPCAHGSTLAGSPLNDSNIMHARAFDTKLS